MTLSPDDAEARPVTEMLRALIEIAKQRGLDEERANETKRKVLRAIHYAKSDKLNDWHYRQCMEKTKKEGSKPNIDWGSYLVRLNVNVQKRLGRENAIEDAKS